MGRHLIEKRWPAIAVGAIVVAGAVLRLCFLGVCLTNDETITYDWSSGSLRGAVQSQYYPLANVLAWCALQIGHAEPVMRLPAFLAGVLSILAIYWLGKNVSSAPAGLVCAALLAVSTFHIQYSHDARYYSYGMLAAIVSMLALERYTATRNVRWLPGWSAGVALGAVSHPFFLLGAAGLSFGGGLWHLLTRRLKGVPRRTVYLALFCIFTAAGLAPVLAYMAPKLLPVAGIAAGAAAPGATRMSYTHILGFAQYAGFLQKMAGSFMPWPAAAIFGLLGLIVLLRKNVALGMGVIAAMLVAVPLFFLKVSHWYAVQYFSYLLPMMTLAVGVGVWAPAGWLAGKLRAGRVWVEPALALVLVIALAAVNAPQVMRYYRTTPEDDWRRVATYLAGRMSPNDVIFLAASYYNTKDKTKSNYQGRPLLHYLDRFQPGQTVFKYETYNGTTPERLYKALALCPNRTVWIPAIKSLLTGEMRKLLPQLCGEPLLDGRPELYVLGEPTVNQVAWGGFEGDLDGLQLRPGAEIVERPEALNGKSLRITSDNAKGVVAVRLPVVMDETGSPAGQLKDGETYTLSLDMKWEDAAPQGSNFRLCVMGLVGRQPDEMGLWKELTYAQGSRDWRHYVYRIVPGETYPAGTRDILVALAIVHGTGTLWVDNVQLEHKLYATPFVQGIRKPRTKPIGAVDQKP